MLATGAIIELQDNLNIIWKAKPDQTFGMVAFVRTRLLSLTLVVGFGFLLMVSLILDAGLSWVGTYFAASFSGVTVLLRIWNSAIAFGIAALLFAMIFKILPAVTLTWRDVPIGAVDYGSPVHGREVHDRLLHRQERRRLGSRAAASIITILLWIYYSSLILLFGAEFTKAYAESRGSRRASAEG